MHNCQAAILRRNLLLVVALLSAVVLVKPSEASINVPQNFFLDGSNGSPSIDDNMFTNYSYSIGMNESGVSFDATLSVDSTGGNLDQASTGLGVSGGLSNLINDDEALSFSLTVTNIVGGTVDFLGFNAVDLTSFSSIDSGIARQLLVPSPRIESLAPNTNTFDPPFPNFTGIFGTENNGGSGTSFRVESISTLFRVTPDMSAVPEATSFLIWMGLMGFVSIRRCRSLES